MATAVSINGVLCGEDDAKISVFDRGFLYGDSVYEVMRTAHGVPVELDLHLERLSRSAAAIALALPAEETIRTAVAAALEATANPESYVRIIATRGAGEIGLAPELAGAPTLIVIVKPLALPPAELYARGASLKLVGVQRTPRRAVDPGVKSGNYLNNIMALAEARRAGAYEAVMCDATGRVAEGSSSNLFVVRGGRLATPAPGVGLLAGITRRRVIALAQSEGIPVAETELYPGDVRGADEVFITSSIRGVLPVAEVDGAGLPAPVPGRVTRRLMDLYQRSLG